MDFAEQLQATTANLLPELLGVRFLTANKDLIKAEVFVRPDLWADAESDPTAKAALLEAASREDANARVLEDLTNSSSQSDESNGADGS